METESVETIILNHYYQKMFNGHEGKLEDQPKLKDIDPNTLNGTLVYLIGKGLIEGKVRYSDNGQAWAIPVGITSSGIDSVKNANNSSNTIVKMDTNDKLDKILKILDENTDLQKKIASILLRMNDRDLSREELYDEMDKIAKEWFSSNFEA